MLEPIPAFGTEVATPSVEGGIRNELIENRACGIRHRFRVTRHMGLGADAIADGKIVEHWDAAMKTAAR